MKYNVIAIDDDELNLEIMVEHLTDGHCSVISTTNSQEAYALICKHNDVDVVILDLMMPNVSGIDILKMIKQNPNLCNIPVIMQTASTTTKSMLEGIASGAYYYLTKPYDKNMLLVLVESAANEAKLRRSLIDDAKQIKNISRMINDGAFNFKTLDDARSLGHFIASCFPDPDRVILGINEIMINAIEHGNLGITYEEKSQLLLDGNWTEEVTKRLGMPEYKDKIATLKYNNYDDKVIITIKDSGRGFAWRDYIEISPNRLTAPNGRGVAMSKMISFSDLYYNDIGNEAFLVYNKDFSNDKIS